MEHYFFGFVSAWAYFWFIACVMPYAYNPLIMVSKKEST